MHGTHPLSWALLETWSGSRSIRGHLVLATALPWAPLAIQMPKAAGVLVFFRVHHSLSDGISLMSLLHACAHHTSNPAKSMKKQPSPNFADKSSSPVKADLKRGNDPNVLNSSREKPPMPRLAISKSPILVMNKSMNVVAGLPRLEPSASAAAAARSIMAAQREHVSLMQRQRKLRFAVTETLGCILTRDDLIHFSQTH